MVVPIAAYAEHGHHQQYQQADDQYRACLANCRMVCVSVAASSVVIFIVSCPFQNAPVAYTHSGDKRLGQRAAGYVLDGIECQRHAHTDDVVPLIGSGDLAGIEVFVGAGHRVGIDAVVKLHILHAFHQLVGGVTAGVQE